MRKSRLAVVLLAGTLVLAGAATAAPSYKLTWSGTTGTGTTGSATIAGAVGDTLTLSVSIIIDPEGFTGAQWDLVGSAGLSASANSLVPLSGGELVLRP